MKNVRFTVISAIAAALVTSCSTVSKQSDSSAAKEDRSLENLVQYANPMSGTGNFPAQWGDNNLFPGCGMPFGMIQWSPDTGAGLKPCGYSYYDTADFRVQPGPFERRGLSGRWQFLIHAHSRHRPRLPTPVAWPLPRHFQHDHESARPGYYTITLENGIKVELTTTTRTGFGRFTYPTGKTATMAINAASDVNKSDDANVDN